MSKDIEMFEISDKHEVVGTEIFDPNMPSNLDFDDKEEDQHEHTFINPEKKIAEMNKSIVIGMHLQEFKVKGKITNKPKAAYQVGSAFPLLAQTHPIRLFDQQSKGLTKLWEAIVGYSKRQIALHEGHFYLLSRRGKGLVVDSLVPLWQLFKVFVDPEDQKIRLVVNEGHRLANIDMRPDNFILVVGLLNNELSALGLSLSE